MEIGPNLDLFLIVLGHGRKIAWLKSEPNSTRPWQHVLEPLSGYLNLALSLKDNDVIDVEPFNFGPLASENKSVREVVSSMAGRWQTTNWKIVADTKVSNKEHNLLQLNCEKAAQKLGWYPVWHFRYS